MMIEVKCIYILVYVFCTLATAATTFETSGRQHLIGDGERLEVRSAPEIDNRFQVRRQAFTSDASEARAGEDANEAHKKQVRQRPRNSGSHRARFYSSPDRFRRLPTSESPINTDTTNTDINQSLLANKLSDYSTTTNLACERFLAFWSQFKAAYPSLAAHLISLGDFNALKFGDDPKLNWRLAKQSIARHLEEAERLAEQSGQHHNISWNFDHQIFNSQLNDENSHLRFTSSAADNVSSKQSWLSRVVSNPFYAKLVQYLQKARQQQQHHQFGNKQRTDPPSNLIQTNKQEQADLHVYGRLVHYPRELATNGISTQTSKTLDKLRQLNQQNRQQQQSNQNLPITNEIEPLTASGQMSELGASSSSKQDQDVESNKIQIAGDGQPWQDRRHDSPLSLADSEGTDSIRNKYVYGSVILKPNQRTGDYNQHHPLDTLRHLNQELDQGRANDDATLMNADPNSSGRKQQQQQEKASKSGSAQTSESYGRILVNPPSLSVDNSYVADGIIGNQVSGVANEATSGDEKQSSARWPIGRPQLTLGKLRQQLEQPAGNENFAQQMQQPAAAAAGDNLDHYAGDELTRQQQHGSSAAAVNAANHALIGVAGETGNEFEGTWHAGPLQQIEVRQTRADEHNPNISRSKVQTTSSSGEVFLID